MDPALYDPTLNRQEIAETGAREATQVAELRSKLNAGIIPDTSEETLKRLLSIRIDDPLLTPDGSKALGEALFHHLEQLAQKTASKQTMLAPDRLGTPAETAIKVENHTMDANDVRLNELHFIASSAPKRDEAELEAFWSTAFHGRKPIFDISSVEAPVLYYPSRDNPTMRAGRFTITHLSDGPPPRYKVEDTTTKETHEIIRIPYTKWPDHSVVSLPELEKLVQLFGRYGLESSTAIIHCLAGRGRTGVLMVALALRSHHSKGELTPENCLKTVQNLVLEARRQRGPCCVEKKEQLQLLLEYAAKLIESGSTEFSDTELQNAMQETPTTRTLRLFRRLVTEGAATGDDRDGLLSALTEIGPRVIELNADQKRQLQQDAMYLRAGLARQTDFNYGTSNPIMIANTRARELNGQERIKLNYLRATLDAQLADGYSNDPVLELFEHPSYCAPDKICDALKIETATLRDYEYLLECRHLSDSSTTHYILTSSTSSAGPKGIKVFTLRWVTPSGLCYHKRFCYNSNQKAWQYHYCLNSSPPAYIGLTPRSERDPENPEVIKSPRLLTSEDALSKVTLDELVDAVLKKESVVTTYQGVPIDKLVVRDRVKLVGGDKSLEFGLPRLVAFAQMPRLEAQSTQSEEGELAPLLLEVPKDTCRPQVFSDCMQSLVARQPLQINKWPDNARADMVREGVQLAEFLGSTKLLTELAPLRLSCLCPFKATDQEAETYLGGKEETVGFAIGPSTYPNSFTLYVRHNDPVNNVKKCIIGVAKRGGFSPCKLVGGGVAMSKHSYKSPEALVAALRLAERLDQQLTPLMSKIPRQEGLQFLKRADNFSGDINYPKDWYCQFTQGGQTVERNITMNEDGTFQLEPLPDEPFNSVEGVGAYMQASCQALVNHRIALTFQPGYSDLSVADAKERLKGAPEGSYLICRAGSAYCLVRVAQDAASQGMGVLNEEIRVSEGGFALKRAGNNFFSNNYTTFQEMLKGEFSYLQLAPMQLK